MSSVIRDVPWKPGIIKREKRFVLKFKRGCFNVVSVTRIIFLSFPHLTTTLIDLYLDFYIFSAVNIQTYNTFNNKNQHIERVNNM
jgi:hypothetical protein